MRIEVASESGVVALGDGTAGLPTGLDQAVLLRQLEPRLPFLVLKSGRRYRDAMRRVSDAELARPHYVIGFVPTPQEELHGGYVRV